MKISKMVICLALAFATPDYSYAQIGKAAKQAVKVFSKKTAKESAEAAGKSAVKKTGKAAGKSMAKKTAKELAEETAESVIVRNAPMSLSRRSIKSVTKEDIQLMRRQGMKKVLSHNMERVAAKKMSGTTWKVISRASVIGESSGERFLIKDLGTKGSKEGLERFSKKGFMLKSEKSAAKKGGIRASRTILGKEALNSIENRSIREMIESLEKKCGPNFALDNLKVMKQGKETIIEFAGTRSRMSIKEGVITAKSGSIAKSTSTGKIVDGELNQFLINKIPNARYKVDDFIIYETDHLGMTKYVEAHSSELYKRMQQAGVFHSGIDKGTREKLLKQFGEFDPNTVDYGHLLRREIGGPNESINALPMLHKKQGSGSRWFKLEEKEVKACKAGKDVKSKMWIDYSPDHKSFSIKVEKTIDGEVITETFKDLI